ncbi:MAG: hypothetical protein LBL91_06175 [Lachnospiraceae bacterium]|jgi:hypothetical protein|nr:hypothetical protein [Lachnospiraceae bacterium]
MFEFFKDIATNIGFSLIKDFTKKISEFITDIIKNTEAKNESGDSAQIGSSGDSAKIGSSGDSAKIGSSGYFAQIGSSGNSAKIGSSGYFAQIGSSGDSAKIGSSGDSAKIGSSGDSAKIGSSGDSAKIGSSGYFAQIEVSGKQSIVADCGFMSSIKAKKGTWITLSEFEECKNSKNEHYLKPIFMKVAQIGNKDYTDKNKKVLSEDKYYTLHNKEFVEVDFSDGIQSIIISHRKKNDIDIYKIKMNDAEKHFKNYKKDAFLVKENDLSAHGETLKKAMEDLTFKKLRNQDISEIVKEIKETQTVTKAQYRIITGACQMGTDNFCQQHKIEEDSITLDKLRTILKNDYGAERFWELIDG